MNDHEARTPVETQVERFLAGVYGLQVPSQTERRERRLYWAGIALVVAGHWLARIVADQQMQTDRVVDAITNLAETIDAAERAR